jgi:hypothetical protein
MLTQSFYKRSTGNFDSGGPELTEIIEAMTQERGCAGIGGQMLANRKLVNGKINTQNMGDDLVVSFGFDNIGAGGAKNLTKAVGVAAHTQKQVGQVAG